MSFQEGERPLLLELVEIAREQLRWQRASAASTVRSALETSLTTTTMRRAYELCDGSRTFRDVSKETGVALGTLSNWSRQWRERGLAFEDSAGRVRHLVGLAALGIQVGIDAEPRNSPTS